MSNALDGWALLYKTVENVIQTKSDVLTVIVHWQLLRAGLKCIGIGEDKNLSQFDEESELLPDGWNINTNSYAIRYKYRNHVFILLGMVVDDSIMFNLFNGESLEVSNASFVLEPTVMALKGPLTTLVPDIESVINRIQKELFEPVLSEKKKTSETQTPPDAQNNLRFSSELFRDPLRDPLRRDAVRRDVDYDRDLRNIGRNDLDPFGGIGGGGMLFNPPGLRNPHSGQIGPIPGTGGPFPGIIPGARFDPFNPPEVERQRRRNSRDFDHFPPPGGSGSSFYDDMFM